MRSSALSTSILLGPAALATAQSAPSFTTAVAAASAQTTALTPAWGTVTAVAPAPTGLVARAIPKPPNASTCTDTVYIKPSTTTITYANRPTPGTTTSIYPVRSTKIAVGNCKAKHAVTTVNQMPGPTSTSGPVPTARAWGRVPRGSSKPPFKLSW